ncbi:MAG: hypothetical protein KBD51_02415 [Candidatus Levybacteria bacterium]|nr:hypothetical protein [Candidatus Levybacteria bacterium]
MTRPNENPEFGKNLDLVTVPGESAMVGFGHPKRYFQLLRGSCEVRYGNETLTADGRRISWLADGGGRETFLKGDVFGAGDGRVLSIKNASVELAVVHEIKPE